MLFRFFLGITRQNIMTMLKLRYYLVKLCDNPLFISVL